MPINNFREDEQVKEVVRGVTIVRLLTYLKSYKKDIALVLFNLIIIIAINTVNPLLIKIAIDRYIATSNYKGLVLIAGIAIGINLVAMRCIYLRINTMSRIANEILMKIRQELYEHIQKLSFNFFDNRPVGKILARVIGDVNSLKDILTNSVITLIPDFVTVIVVLVVMAVINWVLALAALALLPFLVGMMYFINVKSHKRWQVVRKKNSNINAFVHEDFSGIKVVQSYSAENQTSETFAELLNEHRHAFKRAITLNDLFWPMVEVSWGLGSVFVYLLGVNSLTSGNITVGTLVAFTAYISMFWQPIMNLSNFYNQLITNLAGAERIFEILDTDPDIFDEAQVKEMSEINGHVTFSDVNFSYDGTTQILENVSFEVKAGETIALVGPTGAGKTTIVNLISRFYDIQAGEILVDGQNIQQVSIESLRSQMGIMTQDTFLFSGTIRDNIRYGKLDATDEDIEEAAHAVHAHEFIMDLELGYDTLINERATKLSVGQKQLLAFART
ncbi:MAG: ABC transporter ATP-binding protein, partial [Vallitaleaceae bacterium]|nr:ABC transporter ATP-binding protein [Vallitaleaceae bacterium]